MQDKITLGMNRTGIKASPLDAAELLEVMEMQDRTPAPALDMHALRRIYREQAEPVGSVPPPTSIKGVFGATKEAVMGHRLHIFLDKLGERAAYERSGTRLYDGMLSKLQDVTDLPPGMSVEAVREIRDEEAAHFALLADAIERLGGDSTTQTPCADVTGVQGMGLIQAMNDPRTTLAQALQTLLAAEVIDVASWELLIEMARGFDQDELVAQFTHALARETVHAERVQGWLSAELSRAALGR
ncbi:MAG TPA: ferritin-like domain-containing protein, partial [Lysobacter sp.]